MKSNFPGTGGRSPHEGQIGSSLSVHAVCMDGPSLSASFFVAGPAMHFFNIILNLIMIFIINAEQCNQALNLVLPEKCW